MKRGEILLLCFFIVVLLSSWGTGIQHTEAESSNFSYLFEQIFPGEELTYLSNNKVSLKVNDYYSKKYYIEKIIFGNFIEKTDGFLVIIRRHKGELSHAEGFYNAYLAVFDNNNKKITPTKRFRADEGDIRVYKGKTKDYIFFAGSTTYQGWTGWSGGLYEFADGEWQQVWPNDEEFWEHRSVSLGLDRIIINKREILGDTLGVIPKYKFVYDYELFWDADKSRFAEVTGDGCVTPFSNDILRNILYPKNKR